MIKNVNIPSIDLDKQEHLTPEYLEKFCNDTICPVESIRPQSSFVELMGWAKDNFSYVLKDVNVNCYIHNKITIDGQFLQFCQENNVQVKVLYKDSIISYRISNEIEKFLAQGVFHIYSDNFDFLQASLMHKGVNNEDEIGIFVICSNSNFEQYLKFRNQYEDWSKNRDRDNLFIRVVGSEDVPYTRDHNWNDLFLPRKMKEEIKFSVESFLSSKDFYLKNKLPWKKGLIFWGKVGCHAKGTNVILSDGSFKKVEDVEVGDFLLGPDGTPREVLKLVRGNELSYEITPNKGNSFIVNENHLLHLCHSANKNNDKNLPKYLNISVKELLKLSTSLQQRLKLRKADAIEFNNDDDLPIDPYFLGLWLGDGTTSAPELTSADQEIIDYCKEYANKEGMNIKIIPTKSKAFTIRFSRKKQTQIENPLTSKLRKLGIFDKKSIPQQYLTASIENRFKLLAGLIDTDGSHHIGSKTGFSKFGKINRGKGCFDFLQKDFIITEQIAFLVRSLGLGFTSRACTKSIKKTGFVGNYYRSTIYGDIYKIPTIIPRKQATKGNPNKDPLNIGFKSIKPIGNNDYYGFTIDKDHLYLTGDFFIHHNCGKTSMIRTIISQYNFKPVTVAPGANAEVVREAFNYAEYLSPSLLFFEDLDSLLGRTLDISTFLNLLDGVSAINGIFVIATINDLNVMPPSVIKRPSRFDRKFEIPLPDLEMTVLYLKKWFGKSLSDKRYAEIAQTTVANELSYAYLKEIYISSMFEAMSHNRKFPTSKDINYTIGRVLKDKNDVGGNSINTDSYFR